MVDFIIIAIVLCIIAAIVFYIYKAKKRGDACIGCPHAKQCGSKGNCSSGNKGKE